MLGAAVPGAPGGAAAMGWVLGVALVGNGSAGGGLQ